jgi:predicted DNA binding CopG/RHH family protein
MKNKLTPDELKIEEHAAEYIPVTDTKKRRIEVLLAAARKTKMISIRMSEADLERIRQHAQVEGIPYQTLIASIVHKYLNGHLVDELNIRRALHLVGVK